MVGRLETSPHQEGSHAAIEEVCHQLPAMLDEAVKVAVEAKAAPAKRGTRPTYPGRSARKPTLRPVN